MGRTQGEESFKLYLSNVCVREAHIHVTELAGVLLTNLIVNLKVHRKCIFVVERSYEIKY